jgi:hypothetical protein
MSKEVPTTNEQGFVLTNDRFSLTTPLCHWGLVIPWSLDIGHWSFTPVLS